MTALAIFGALRVPCEMFANVVVALGRPRRLLAIQIAWFVALVPAMIIGVHVAGIEGAGWAHVTVMGALVLPLYAVTVRRLTAVRLSTLLAVHRSTPRHVRGGGGHRPTKSPGWRAARGLRSSGDVHGLGVYVATTGRWLWHAVQRLRSVWSGASEVPPSPDEPASDLSGIAMTAAAVA